MAKHQSPPVEENQQRRFRRRRARAQGRLEDRQTAEVRRVEGLGVVNAHAAGIDIGSFSHWVCVGAGVSQEFPAHTDGLHAIVVHLREQLVTTVAMESTGIYWIPLYELLEAEGFEVLLVDPGYTRQVKGRPKTDRLDCQWIYRLHSVGLLAAAFRPDEKTCQLRSYLRQRANLIRYGGQHIQHMQKALEQMNLKLTEIISDITGLTGENIIRAILRGVRDPRQLAKYRNCHCKASEAEIAQALTGTYRDEHLYALKQAYEAWRFYAKQRDEIDEQIQQQLARMKQDRNLPPLKPRKLVHGPQIKKTGGVIKSSRTRPGANRAAAAFRLAAFGLHASKGALGAFLRRKKAHLGAPKALVAAAHKLARLVYYALKNGLTYVRQTQEAYETKMRAKQFQSLQRRARQLGFALVDAASGERAAFAT